MRLFLAPNGFTDIQVTQATRCFRVLADLGHDCAVSLENSLAFFSNDSGARFAPEECDLIVSLGGDGSVLRAARTAVALNKPLLGINSGRLGYLCALDFSEIDRFNARLEGCVLSRRSLASFAIEGETRYALNDVIVGKPSFGETVDLDVAIQGMEPFRLRGDGLIIATPTGSTAYNLSAGGATVEPTVPCILLTPVCPHGSKLHPMVLDERRQIAVSVRNGVAGLYADGRNEGALMDRLTVRVSQKRLSLYLRGETTGMEHRP